MSPSVLLVRYSAIGDCIMLAWAATAIRLAWPKARIVWAVQRRCAPAIDEGRLADARHIIEREAWKKRRFSPATWREELRSYLALRKQRFDIGLDFQGHSKTALCLRLAAPKVRLASRATDVFARSLNPVPRLKPRSKHEVDLNYALIREVGEFDEAEAPILPPLTEPRAKVRKLFADSRPMATIQMGAGHPDKGYPAAYWGAVAAGLLEAGYGVTAIGGPGDPGLECKGANNLVGRCDLETSLAAVAESDLHLAADTGTGHAAAAFGVPAVAVFGPTDPERYRPWSPRTVVLRNGPNPASVSPKEVLEAAFSLMEGRQLALFD